MQFFLTLVKEHISLFLPSVIMVQLLQKSFLCIKEPEVHLVGKFCMQMPKNTKKLMKL